MIYMIKLRIKAFCEMFDKSFRNISDSDMKNDKDNIR